LSPALHAWTRIVVLLALVKVATGLVAFFVVAGDQPLLPAAVAGDATPPLADVFYLLFLLSFGGAGIGLVLVGRDDPRALSLAGFLLAVATAYCNLPLREMVQGVGSPVKDVLENLEALELQAFMPFFLWSFVQTFPELTLPMRTRRQFHIAVLVSLWIGIVLVCLNGAGFLLRLDQNGAGLAQRAFKGIAPQVGGGLFYGLIFPPLAAALVALVWKARRATGEGRRRVQMLAGIMAGGLALVVVEVLCEYVIPGYSEYIKSHPRTLFWIRLVVFIPAWLVPCGIAYAAVVHHVLGLRLFARQALQYALARLTVLTLAAAPLIALFVSLYLQRDRTVGELLSGNRLLLLAMVSGVGFAALRYRTRLLEGLDRRYFREQYDARRLLTGLVQLLRSARGTREIADLLCRDVDRALHLERVALFAADPRTGDLVDPRSRARLDASTPLARLVAGASDPLAVDLDDPHSSVATLPAADRSWLAGAGFQLLVPLVARDGSLLGFLGLGPKRSGLPFLREDRRLLEAIAGSAALGLELDTQPQPEEEDGPSSEVGNAKECPVCLRLFRPFTVLCTHDSHRLEAAPVPYVLPGKLRFEQRIGAGGMGVVYRGIDLGLSRPVAIKTLRRVSPDDALRLRREARTAASFSHPHLAGVYGVETWQGTPMLVMELMEGGTLTQRIEKGPFGERETIDLGLAMAAALEHLHAADILHRDIKPSNIGFTRNGVPKLMDFGIARLMFDLRREQAGSSDDTPEDGTPILPPASIWDRSPTSITRSRQLVGTISYLSPEALQGEPADLSFDLWSLCLVLYECLLGRKIFTGADHKQLLARIRNGRVPDFEQALPQADPALGFFFREALHRTVARRPATAGELRRRLEEVRGLLGNARN
jgi:hypothetical protein